MNYSAAALTVYSAPQQGQFQLPPLDGHPSKEARSRTRLLANWLSRDVPGQQLNNQFAQVDNYQGAQYISIRAKIKSIMGATVKVMIRNQKYAGRMKKSLGGDEDESEEWIEAPRNHQVVELFDNPNPTQTLPMLLGDYLLMLELCGGAFLWGSDRRQRSQKPTQLWVLRTPYITSSYQVSEEYPEGAWQVNIPAPMTYGYAQSGFVLIDARELAYLKYSHPRYPWAPYSPLQAGGLQIDTLQGVNQTRKNMLDRGGTVDGVINIAGASETSLKNYETRWKEKYTGASRGDRIMFTGDDSVTAEALNGFAPKDMAFESGYDQLTKFVSALSGTPGQITGLVDAESYASFYAAQLQFQTTEMGPLCKQIGEYWTLKMIRPCWGPDIKLVVEPPRIDDKEMALQEYAQDVDILTVNERRKMRNHRPLGPEGDVPAAIYTAKIEGEMQQEQQAQAAMQGQMGAIGGDGSQGEGNPQDQSQQGDGESNGVIGDTQEDADSLMSGALLDSLGADQTQGNSVVAKSLRVYRKALDIIAVPLKNGGTGAKYSGSDRVYYGETAKRMLERHARNTKADFKTSEHEHDEAFGESPPPTPKEKDPFAPKKLPITPQATPAARTPAAGGDVNPLNEHLARRVSLEEKHNKELEGKGEFAKLTSQEPEGSEMLLSSAKHIHGIADSLVKTGKMPSSEQGKPLDQLWDIAKGKFGDNPESRKRMALALWDMHKNGGDGITPEGKRAALNRHFADFGKAGEQKPAEQSYGDKVTDAITGGVGPPQTKPGKVTLHVPPTKGNPAGPGVEFDNADDAQAFAAAFGLKGHEIRGADGKPSTEGAKSTAGGAFKPIADAVKSLPANVQPKAMEAAKKVAQSMPVVAQRLQAAKLQPEPASFADKFANASHGIIGSLFGMKPEAAHAFAKNLAQGFARGLIMRLTHTYLPIMGTNQPAKPSKVQPTDIEDVETLTPDRKATPRGRSGATMAARPKNQAGKGSLGGKMVGKSLKRFARKVLKSLGTPAGAH